MPVRVRRIAGRAVVALVERQEVRRRPFEARRHEDFAVADREMDERPVRKAQERLGVLAFRLRVAVEAVLVDRVLDALGEIGLQFDGRDRQAVEEENEVERVLVGLRIVNLPHDAKAVGGVAGEDVGVHRQRRLELGEREGLPQADDVDAMAQHVERAAIVELLADAVEQNGLPPPRRAFLVSASQALGCVASIQAMRSDGKRARARS